MFQVVPVTPTVALLDVQTIVTMVTALKVWIIVPITPTVAQPAIQRRDL